MEFILRILTGWQKTIHRFILIFSLCQFYLSSQTHHSILGIDTFPFVLQLCYFPLLLDTFLSSWRGRIFPFPLYTVCYTDSSYPNYSSHDFCQLEKEKKQYLKNAYCCTLKSVKFLKKVGQYWFESLCYNWLAIHSQPLTTGNEGSTVLTHFKSILHQVSRTDLDLARRQYWITWLVSNYSSEKKNWPTNSITTT